MTLPVIFDDLIFGTGQFGRLGAGMASELVTGVFVEVSVNGTIEGIGLGSVDVQIGTGADCTTLTLTATGEDSSDSIVLTDGSQRFFLSNTPKSLTESLSFPDRELGAYVPNGVTLGLAPGTLVAAADGQRAVETLRPGDRICSSEDRMLTVRTIDCRSIDLTSYVDASPIRPIVIRAGALGPGVPARDLSVRSGQEMLVEGRYVQARRLVNGTSIVVDHGMNTVVWYRLGLESDGTLLAEGAPAAGRAAWSHGKASARMDSRRKFLNPGRPHAAPVAAFGSSQADPATARAIWQRIADRGEALGFGQAERLTTTDDPGLTIRIGNRDISPIERDGDTYTFSLPACDVPVWLVSRSTAPDALAPWLQDRRQLGVSIRGMTLCQGTDVQTIPADHPMLLTGWWAAEYSDSSVWRWTNGRALITPSLSSATVLTLRLGPRTVYTVSDDIPVPA